MGTQPARPGPCTLRALCKGLGEAALAEVSVDPASAELRIWSIAVRVGGGGGGWLGGGDGGASGGDGGSGRVGSDGIERGYEKKQRGDDDDDYDGSSDDVLVMVVVTLMYGSCGGEH